MNLEPVIDRLDGVSMRPVQSVAALAALGDRPPQFMPAIYVVPDGEQAAAPRGLVGIHDQQLVCTFVVVVMVASNAADPGHVAEQLQQLCTAVETRLIGWVHPDAGGQATEHAGAALLGMSDGRIEWAIRLRTQRRLRAPITA